MAIDGNLDNSIKEPSVNFLPEHKLFWGVHCNTWCHWKNFQTNLSPSAFKIRDEDGMSVDWSKYCPTPNLCFKYRENPQKNGIVKINVSTILDLGSLIRPSLELEHDPRFNERINEFNQAHSLIKNFPPINNNNVQRNDRKEHIRVLLADQPDFSWGIIPSRHLDICRDCHNQPSDLFENDVK